MKSSESIALPAPALAWEYVRLMKPELTLLSVLTAVGSTYLAMRDAVQYQLFIHTFIGTILIGGAAGTFNQYIERQYDGLMKRTAHRALPSGAVSPRSAFIFGLILAAGGIAYLFLTATIAAGVLGIFTLLIYLCIYTPLKRRTPFATVVGGIAGALPPLIGWTVVRGSLTIEAWSLFFILFFWQMPHFLALAWICREDYRRAGYKLLVVLDPTGDITGRQILIYCGALIPASLMPVFIGSSGYLYFGGALLLSLSFFTAGFVFFRDRYGCCSTPALLFFNDFSCRIIHHLDACMTEEEFVYSMQEGAGRCEFHDLSA